MQAGTVGLHDLSDIPLPPYPSGDPHSGNAQNIYRSSPNAAHAEVGSIGISGPIRRPGN